MEIGPIQAMDDPPISRADHPIDHHRMATIDHPTEMKGRPMGTDDHPMEMEGRPMTEDRRLMVTGRLTVGPTGLHQVQDTTIKGK